jgi:hypothetical protein
VADDASVTFSGFSIGNAQSSDLHVQNVEIGPELGGVDPNRAQDLRETFAPKIH